MSDELNGRIDLADDAEWSREVYGDALVRKKATGACEACGQRNWGVSERLMLMQALDAGGRLTPGRGVEVVTVFCRRCGLLRLHAATLLLRD
jgi:ribosomal protein L37E